MLLYPLVVKIAMLVNKAVLLKILLHAPGLNKPIVEQPKAEPPPTRISVINNEIFFLFNDSYFF